MRYVVTFENYDGDYESVTIDAPYMEYAIMDAKEKINEKHSSSNYYSDCDVLSAIRV